MRRVDDGEAGRASKVSRVELSADPDICTCGLHGFSNWQRIAMLNDSARMQTLRDSIDAVLGTAQVSCGEE